MSKHIQQSEVAKIATLCTLIDVCAEREAIASYSLQKQGVRTWTYRELFANVLALARRLSKLGVRKGDRIALLAFNRSETIMAVLRS